MKNDTAPAQTLDTPKELATALKCTPQTILNWHRAGTIPAAFACGRIIRFDRAEVMAALQAKTGRASA